MDGHTLIHTAKIHYFTIQKKDTEQQFQLRPSRLWSCGIWTQWSWFVNWPVLLLWNDSLSFTTAWNEPAVSLLICALQKTKQSACWHWMSTIYTYRHASCLYSCNEWGCCVCMFAWPYSIGEDKYLYFHWSLKKKPAEWELGWLPMARNKELMLSDLFLFFPTE